MGQYVLKNSIRKFPKVGWINNLSTKRSRKYDKKNVNLILEKAMPKTIIEVYFELLLTNFYAQISCSCHLKFAKIILILMHR